MFGGVETETPERKPFNIDEVETSTNQQNLVLPYFAGVAACTVDWVTNLQRITSRSVGGGGTGKGGKGGGGGETSQKEWRADVGGHTNACPDDAPNDAILHIIVNGEPVLGGTDPLNPQAISRAPGTHYAAFSIPKFSQACRFYWGTKDQPIDDLVLSLIAGEMHPAYRNQGLFVARQWFLGSSPTLQSIVFVLARGGNVFETRFEAVAQGINPMVPIYELVTDELVGCGYPAARLGQASFEATAAAMTADDMLVAPALREPRSARNFLADASQYTDVFWRRIGSQLEAGIFTHGDIDVAALPELGAGDIIGEPNITPGSHQDTQNTFFVNFSNREKWYKGDDTDRVIDHANWLDTGVKVARRLERPDIIDGVLAVRHCNIWSRIYSKIPAQCGLDCRRDRLEALGLLQGDRFKSNVDSLALSFVWRIMGIESPSDRSGVLKLTLENERGIYPALWDPPPAPQPPGFTIVPSTIEKARIVELRAGLRVINAGVQVAVLAQRPSQHILGAKVHVSPDDDIYQHVATPQHFSAYGEVVTAYPDTTDELDLTVGLILDLSGEDKDVLASQTESERDDNHLLLWIGNEIMSVGQVVALGADQFKIFPRRARYGTSKGSHAVDATCFILYRAWVLPIAHSSFVAGETRYFKLQPYTYGGDLDLELVDPIPYTFHTSAPVGSVFNLALTSNAYVDEQGERHALILAAWDYLLDQDIIVFGVAYRRTSSVGMLYNEEQDLAFALSANGAPGNEEITLAEVGTNEPASLVRLYNEEQESYFDVICTGPAGQEEITLIPAADPAPGSGLDLFNLDQNNWCELICEGAPGEEVLGLSESFATGLPAPPSVPGVPARPWVYVTIDVPDIAIPVTSGVSYDVKVRPINSFGEPGEYCDPETIIASAIDLFQIDNLEIAGQGADHTLYGVDCHLAWEVVSPAQGTSIRGGPSGQSGGGRAYDPGLVDFEIKIYEGELTLEQITSGFIAEGVPVVRVWRDVARVPEYNFSLQRNMASVNGPHMPFTAWVGGFDAANRSAAPQVIVIDRPALPEGGPVEWTTELSAVNFGWVEPDIEGLDRAEIFLSGYSSEIIRRVASPGTTHRFDGLVTGASYKFLFQWVDKFGGRSPFYETPWITLSSGGAVNLGPITFSPNGGAIDNTENIFLSSPNPGAQIYWANGAVANNTTADNLYDPDVGIDVDGETEFDITASAYLGGVMGPATTKHFDPFTAGGGGGGGDPVVAPTFDQPSGTHYRPTSFPFDTALSSPTDDCWLFWTAVFGNGAAPPPDPTHDAEGDPTGDTASEESSLHNFALFPGSAGGRVRIKALAWKPGVSPPDSAISFADFTVIKFPPEDPPPDPP